jgi:hypothetical protein
MKTNASFFVALKKNDRSGHGTPTSPKRSAHSKQGESLQATKSVKSSGKPLLKTKKNSEKVRSEKKPRSFSTKDKRLTWTHQLNRGGTMRPALTRESHRTVISH